MQENGIFFILNWLPPEESTCGYFETSCKFSCTISPTLHYVVSVWGLSLSHDLQFRLERMFNRAVRVVYGLRNVSPLWKKFGWLSVQSLIQHHCLLMLYRHYHSDTENTILLSPPINLADISHYDTRTTPYFAAPCRFRLSFTQKCFVQKRPILVDHLLSLSQIVIMALRS